MVLLNLIRSEASDILLIQVFFVGKSTSLFYDTHLFQSGQL